MSLVRALSQKKTEGTGASAPPQKDAPEVIASVKAMIDQQGPEYIANIARLASSDPGAYQQLLQEQLIPTFGPVGAELIDKEIQDRLTGRPMKSEDKEKQKGMDSASGKDGEATDKDKLAEKLSGKVASDVGIDPELAKKASEEAAASGGEDKQAKAEAKSADLESKAEGAADKLVEQLSPDVGVDASKVPIKADAQAASQLNALNASGAVIDGMVFLHPDEYNPNTASGQALFAEEMAHAVQLSLAQQGGGAVLSSPAAVESEAKTIAAAYAAGQKPPEVVNPLPVGYTAANTGKSGPAKPPRFTFNVGGREIAVPLPLGEDREVTVAIPESGIPGLTLSSADLVFDEGWNLTRGIVHGGVAIGSFVTMSGLQLPVQSNGAVQCEIRGATLKVSDLINSSIDLHIGQDGLTGSATVMHEQIQLPLGIILLTGIIRVSMDNTGSILAVGNIAGELPGIGLVAINATLNNELVGGTVSLTMPNAKTLATGVTMESASLSGNFTRDEWVVNGRAHVKLMDWAEGVLVGTYQHPTMMWSGQGVLRQTMPQTFGDLELTEALLDLSYVNGNLGGIGGGGRISTPDFSGSFGGEYDPGANSFNGEGVVKFTEAQVFGEEGGIHALIEEGTEAKVTVTDNAITEFPGNVPFLLMGSTGELGTGEIELSYERGKFSTKGTYLPKSPIELLDGRVLLTNATGEVKIENNELTFAGGKTSVVLEEQLDVKTEGVFDYSWTITPGEGADGSSPTHITMDEVNDNLKQVLDLIGTVLELIQVGNMTGPMAPIGVAGYLAYRVYIKKNLSIEELKAQLGLLWPLLEDGFKWIQGNLPDAVTEAYEWVQSGAENVLLEMGAWMSANLQDLGSDAVDFLKDSGDWGSQILSDAGKWAKKKTDSAMDSISEAGAAIADSAGDAWDAVATWS